MINSKEDILKFNYDDEADVLYAFFGKPRAALSEEIDEGVAIRKDPYTNEIVGFVVVDYMKRKTLKLLNKIPFFDNISLP